MEMTFKRFPIENQQKSIKLYIDLVDHNDDNINAEVEIIVDYTLLKDDQNYDHEKESYGIDSKSIEYDVNSNFEYDNKQYSQGTDLSEFYDNVFFDDKYIKKSKYLQSKIKNYFMDPKLSKSDKEEIFSILLITMIQTKV